MRLRVLDSGHRLRGRTFFWLMRAVAGTEDAVAKTSLYRPSFFGRALLRFIRSAMRGQSDWSAGGRELFAALVSRLNSCPFCVSVHVGITALALNPTITAEQLDHWRDIGLRSQVAATLAFLEKVTLHPDQVGVADVQPLRAAGVSEAAIVDALHVCFLFNVVNRLFNSFGYDWGNEANALKGAAILNRIGYRVPEFLMR